MKLAAPGSPHLTYCTNIHPGETWPEVRGVLEREVTAVKTAIAPADPFGVGLRLSAAAATALDAAAERAWLAAFLAAQQLYVFTINGFPYGAFHGTRVKEAVYAPDWRDPARLAYSDRLATLLATLLPAGMDGSVSTVPGAFHRDAATPAARAAITEHLLRHVATLLELEATTGRCIRLALEPEPWCIVEAVADTVAFFEAELFTATAATRLAALSGRSVAASASGIRRHLGVCLDACHLAVAFEEPAATLAAFGAAGIAVPKIQVSAGMVAELGGADADTPAALSAFADDVYLHQVVERRASGERRRFLDLPEALAAPADGAAREWRVHFHVPLFRAALGAVRSTQPWVTALLATLRAQAYAGHLEVETYTWDVLPASFRGEPVAVAVARELAWVREQLES